MRTISLEGIVVGSTNPISQVDQAIVSYNAMLKSRSTLLIVQEAPTCNFPLKDEAFSCIKTNIYVYQ